MVGHMLGQSCGAEVRQLPEAVSKVPENCDCLGLTMWTMPCIADMLAKGFEWTYKYGEPKNIQSRTYMVQPKCCSVIW